MYVSSFIHFFNAFVLGMAFSRGLWYCLGQKGTVRARWNVSALLFTCTCVGIHPGRVEPASPTALTTSRTEALQARRSCASSLDTFTQSFLHRAWPKTRGPEIGSRSALIVVAHVFSWPPARLRHVRGDVGRRRSLISSPSGRSPLCLAEERSQVFLGRCWCFVDVPPIMFHGKLAHLGLCFRYRCIYWFRSSSQG